MGVVVYESVASRIPACLRNVRSANKMQMVADEPPLMPLDSLDWPDLERTCTEKG